MKELQKIEETPSTNDYITDDGTSVSAGGTNGATSGSNSAPSLSKGSYVSVKPGTKWYSNSYGGGKSGAAHSGTIKYVNNGGTHPYNIDGLGWVKKSDIVGYKNGGIVDYTGLAMLHGSPSKPEFVFNNEQTKKILSMIMNPNIKHKDLSGNTTTNTYNFGNIELPNVNNVKQFMAEVKSLVNTTKHQTT